MVEEAKAFEPRIAGRLYRAGLRRCLWLRPHVNDNLFELSGYKGVLLPIVDAETDGRWLAWRGIVPGVLEFGALLLGASTLTVDQVRGERLICARYKVAREMTVVSASCFRTCVREWECISLIPGARITLRWGSCVDGMDELVERYRASMGSPRGLLSGGERV